jgi:hypothetical protein
MKKFQTGADCRARERGLTYTDAGHTAMHCAARRTSTDLPESPFMFTLNPKSTTPLVVQIVEGFRDLIQSGNLRPGSKAPTA